MGNAPTLALMALAACLGTVANADCAGDELSRAIPQRDPSVLAKFQECTLERRHPDKSSRRRLATCPYNMQDRFDNAYECYPSSGYGEEKAYIGCIAKAFGRG
eukprot:SAG25_NODE_4078_length_895_cov_13.917085_1_plen_103_part_00